MNGKYLLDTNIVIALFADEPSVVDQLRMAQSVFVPSVVIGELYFGAYRSSRMEANLRRVEEFASFVQVLNCDAGTAKEYGRIKDQPVEKIKRPSGSAEHLAIRGPLVSFFT